MMRIFRRKGDWLSKASSHIQRYIKGEKIHSKTLWAHEDPEQGSVESNGEQECWICQVAKEIPGSEWFDCHSRSFQKSLVVKDLE